MADLLMLMPRIGYMDARRSKPSLPLSILHAVSLVCHSSSVKIIDQRVDRHFWLSLEEELKKEPLLIGITSWTGPMIKDIAKMLRFIKGEHNIPIVLGGIHPSILPEQTISSPYIDFIITGEGERSLLQLLNFLKGKGSIEDIKGLYYKSPNGKIEHNSPENFLDLNTLPDLPYELVDIPSYLPVYQGKKSISLESSRGCPFACRYCYQSGYNQHKWRSKNSQKVIATASYLKDKYNVDDIYFIDDNFFINLDRGLEIAEGFVDLKLTYQVQGVDIISLTNMNDNYFNTLAQSGLKRITIGVETVSAKLRKFLNKKGNIEDILYIIKSLKKYNFTIYCNFFGGYPEEAAEDIKKNIHFMFKLLNINPNVRISPYYMYTPFPGSYLYGKYIKDKVFSPPGCFEEWGSFSWEDSPFIIEKKELYKALYFLSLFMDAKSQDYLKSSLKKIVLKVYSIIARIRLKHFYFKGMLELKLYNSLLK